MKTTKTTKTTSVGKKFRSKLERFCYKLLMEEGLDFEYEPFEIILLEGFMYEPPSGEKIGSKKKIYKQQRKKQSAIKYRPDFVGQNGVIETKGFFTPQARLKGKLFKKGLNDNNKEGYLFMPSNKTEIKTTIKMIKEGVL